MDGLVRQVEFIEQDAAGIRRDEPDDHVESSGLTCAVRTEQADDLARADLERQVTDHGACAIGLGEVAGDQSSTAVARDRCAHGVTFGGVASCGRITILTRSSLPVVLPAWTRCAAIS